MIRLMLTRSKYKIVFSKKMMNFKQLGKYKNFLKVKLSRLLREFMSF